MSVTVTKAAAFDVPDIARAESAYIDCPWSEQMIVDELEKPNSIFLVAREDGRFCGYISCTVAADECEVANVAVEKDARRRGIASALFTRLCAEAKRMGAKNMFLLVADDNLGASALYKKLGFAECGRRKGYYGGTDAVCMKLTL